MTLADRARAEALSDAQYGLVRDSRDQKLMAGAFIVGAEWQAAQEPTPEQVEAAARAWAAGGPTPGNWDNMAERLQDLTRDRMRAALRAAQEAGR